jgi:hypothetical protein
MVEAWKVLEEIISAFDVSCTDDFIAHDLDSRPPFFLA